MSAIDGAAATSGSTPAPGSGDNLKQPIKGRSNSILLAGRWTKKKQPHLCSAGLRLASFAHG